MKNIFTKTLFIFLVVALFAGVLTGYLLGQGKTNTAINSSGEVESSKLTKGTIVGSNDTKTFKDIATGIVKSGGINGEGQFHLVRPGGNSQNVYMTSSIVDLSKFVNRKVKVWGETQAAQYAGWLMDVGRVEVVD